MHTTKAASVFLLQTGLTALTQGLMWTMLAVYEVRVVGMGPLQLVLAGTFMECAVLLFQLPSGAFADVWGRRGSVAFGTVLSGAGVLIMVARPVFGVAALGLAVWGVGVTFVEGAREAWIAERAGEEAVASLFVRAAQVSQIAGIAGTAASAWVVGLSLRAPFLVGGVLTVALGVFLAFAMEEEPRRRPVASGPSAAGTASGVRGLWARARAALGDLRAQAVGGLAAVRRSPALRPLLGVTVLAGAGSEGWDRLWQAHLLRQFRFPALGGLRPVAWFAVVGVAGQLGALAALQALRRPMDALAPRQRPAARTLAVLAAVGVAATAAFGLTDVFAAALAAAVVKSVARATAAPLYETWLVRSADPDVRATVLSLCGQADALGQIAGGPAVGAVGSLWGLRAAMLAVAATLVPTLPLYLRAEVAGEGGPGVR